MNTDSAREELIAILLDFWARKIDAEVAITRIEQASRERYVPDLERRNGELETCLLMVKRVIQNSDAWWINCPDKGGIDEEMIDEALTRTKEQSNGR